MDISTLISSSRRIHLSAQESKIPWDEPAFSQRMLENHLSQEHDWASRRRAVIEQQVAWIAGQLPAGARILDLGCGPGNSTRLLRAAWRTIFRRITTGPAAGRRSLSCRSSGSPVSYPLAHISSILAAAPGFIPTA